MAESIIRLTVNSSEYDNKLKQATQGLTRYVDECRKIGGTLEVVEKDTLDYVRALGQMETTSRTATGKLAEMKKAFVEFSAQYKQMTDAEKASPMGKALAASLDQLKTRIQESKSQLDDINKSINGGGGLTGALDNLAGKFGMSVQSLASWGTALAAAKGTLDVAKDAFFASEATVDEWGRVMDSSKSLYEGFLTALNTGDISGYLSRIDSIVQAARIAYNELDRLGTMKTIQAPQMSAQQTENERMRMMIQTGRYIAPIDGRKASMQNGQLLTPDQITRIEKQLQGGMQKVVTLVGNEVAQTGRAIDAVYNRQAQELGMSLKEFRKGTSSMAEFDKRMAGYDQYQKWRAEHTTIDMQSGRETVARGNPFEQFAKWGTFRVDGDRYNDLVKLIQQRDQQAGQAYSMQSQAYRTMNRAEGVTLRQLMSGGSGGGGANVNDATINYVVERIMKNGQSEFDKYHRNFQILQQKGMVTRTQTINDSQGGTYERQYKEFDINALNKEQRKQYAIAKAVTEGETRIQKGIATYAQAVQEGAASAREQFKGNRYALQGSGGGGGKGGNTTITEEKDEFTEIIGLVGNAQERVSDLQRQISESWDEGEIARLTGELKVAQRELQRLKDIGKEKPMQQGLSGFNQQTMSAWMQGRQGDLAKAEYGSADYSSIMGNIADMNTIKTILEQSMKAGINAAQFDLSGLWEKVFDGDDIPDATWQEMVNKINEKLKEMKLEPISIEFKTGEIAKDGKIIKSSYKDAASAVNSLGSALSGLDDPGAKIAGTIAQAIANIALAFSSADLKEGESGNIWYWIAATAAGMATMISTISAIHSATGYQNGGVVKGYQRGGVVKGYAGGKPVMGYAGGGSIGSAISGGMITGSTYSNDQIPIMANAGEVVLTNAMTTTLASKLNDQGNTGYVPSHISGEQIYIALNRFMRRSGRGEIVTWKS